MSTTKDKLVADKRLLAADMWSVFNYGNPSDRYSRFLARGRPAFKRLIESILLYEKTIIPTQDFLSLTILVGVLGEQVVLDLLEAERIEFLRIRGGLAYFGNGSGIQAYEAKSPEGNPRAFSAPMESAISWALDGLLEKPKNPLLPRLVIERSTEIDIKSIANEIRHETYMDVLESPYLRNIFALRNHDMNKLGGIKPNGVRIYGGPDSNAVGRGDEIDIVMSLAATNLELRLGQSINCSDASTASPVGHLIKAKAERTLGKLDAGKSFAVLQEIVGIPDLGEAVLERQVSVRQIIELSQTRNGVQFQDWFHKHCRENPIVTAREYIELLQDVPKVQSLPTKIMRFIATTATGFIPVVGPLLGVAAGAVDSFFIEKWLRGSSAKFFIDDLQQLQGKPNDHTRKKKAKGD